MLPDPSMTVPKESAASRRISVLERKLAHARDKVWDIEETIKLCAGILRKQPTDRDCIRKLNILSSRLDGANWIVDEIRGEIADLSYEC